MKILHLSDLHVTNQDISQDIVLTSLQKKIKELSKNNKFDLLIITGDIVYSGKKTEYEKAYAFIRSILDDCSLEVEKILFVPGNHDIDRDKIKREHLKWWYSFENEQEVTDTLYSKDSFPIIIEKSKNYLEFIKRFNATDNISYGKFGEYVYDLPIKNKSWKIKIIGINSSIFCGYDGDDKQKLAIGIEQVSNCEAQINPDNDILITCIHHPKSCYHPCDKTSFNILKRISDIILSGHLHEVENSAYRDGTTGDTILISAGASYEKRETENAFDIIDLDLEKLKGSVQFFKYLPHQNIWIENKEINHQTEGIFAFELTKKLNTRAIEKVNSNDKEIKFFKYKAIIELPYDEFDREKLKYILTNLQNDHDVKIEFSKITEGSIHLFFNTNKKLENLEIFKTSEKFINAKVTIQYIEQSNGPIKPEIDKSILNWDTKLKKEFLRDIKNPGASFTHRNVDYIFLSDLYIDPNLEALRTNEKGVDKFIKWESSKEVLKKSINDKHKIVIYGTENSGKTTLLKWWFMEYYEKGNIPILINGAKLKEISLNKLTKIINDEFISQYDNISDINLYDKNRVVLLIDDFHKVKFSNPKFKNNLLLNLNKLFDNIIITGNDILQLETYRSKSGISHNILSEYDRYRLLEFGPKQRYNLIEKWNNIGNNVNDENELIRLNKESESRIETIIGRNFVPAFPVYLLTILQTSEISNIQNPEYNLHGFYYERLISDALNKAIRNKSDISFYYNFLTEYSYYLFESKIRLNANTLNDFIGFYDNYCKEYNIQIKFNIIKEVFNNSLLVKINDNDIRISYKYVYYFFVARYLSNNIAHEKIKHIVKLLSERIYRDEYASIIMFLTHLSKDQYILNQLLENSKNLFNEYEPAKLEKDINFINEMINILPVQVYEPIDIKLIKEEELKEEEDIEIQEREFGKNEQFIEYDIDEDISTLDIVSKLVKSIKTIELIGQVTKKYWGELKSKQKYDLAIETYNLGLRSLKFYFSLLSKDPQILIDYLKFIYRKKHKSLTVTKEEIDRASRDYLFGLCVTSSFGIIKRITGAIGYEKLTGTFQEIIENNPFNSYKLIDTSIKLEHNKLFPWDEIKSIKEKNQNNFLVNILLKTFAIDYLYLFHTSFEEKQKICSLL
ncbi:MAG TPA: metallophosphoesterase, partial [Ignavibacteria bacterium]|nr:metallophosphoesterase [Ignavibacteria bacterium]